MNPVCQPEGIAVPETFMEFMRSSRIGLDQLQWLEPGWIPQPYRDLLAHQREMTPTLEAFHGDTLRLKVLRAQEMPPARYIREVVLFTSRWDRPVIYGVIEVYLERFTGPEVEAILAGREPFGRILIRGGRQANSQPIGYFRYDGAFPFAELPYGICYGRYNRLLDQADEPLATIIEIMAPLPDDG